MQHSIIIHSLLFAVKRMRHLGNFLNTRGEFSFEWTFLSIFPSFLSPVSQTIFLTERHDARGEEYFVYVIMRQVRVAVTYGCNDKLLMQVSHLHTSYIYLYAFSRGNLTAEITRSALPAE